MSAPTGPGRVLEIRAVGDVAIDRDQPDTALALVADTLKAGDLTYGNCESTYSERGARNPHARGMVRAHPCNTDALAAAGFDVMSFANNHHMDAGPDAFFDTLAVLDRHGIVAFGAGATLAEARRPAIVERSGTRVAWLGYSSILWPGYAATDTAPGCAPLRVETSYEQVELEQPGSPPRIRTRAVPGDLAALVGDVRAAKAAADVVVVTPHWGLHFVPGTVADYENEVGRAAIDAGADLVLGCHQHVPKPIQVYRGKVIFHGLGNFVMDVNNMAAHADSPAIREMQELYPGYAVAYQPDYPTYPFHATARRSMIARCRITDGVITEVGYLPCLINSQGQPEQLVNGDPRFSDVTDHVAEVTAAAGFGTRLVIDGDEVRVNLDPQR